MTLPRPLPTCDRDDVASLESFYGPFGYAEHFRKIVLSSCRELVRAESHEVKLSEAKIDDRARLHPNYVDFLIESLEGRRRREAMALERIGL